MDIKVSDVIFVVFCLSIVVIGIGCSSRYVEPEEYKGKFVIGDVVCLKFDHTIKGLVIGKKIPVCFTRKLPLVYIVTWNKVSNGGFLGSNGVVIQDNVSEDILEKYEGE